MWRLMPEGEAAQCLGVAVATLRRWRWAGRGPKYAKIGAAVRYDAEELRAYVERSMRRSTSDSGEAQR